MRRSIRLCGRTVSYELQRKAVKNINLRIRPDGSVAVSANRWVPIAAVEAFLQRKGEAIVAALDRFERAAQAAPLPLRYETGDRLFLYGEPVTLRVEEGLRNAVRPQGSELVLTVRDRSDTAMKEKVLDNWRKEECARAMEEICRDIYPLFQPYGVKFPQFRFRKMRSRWGSCSPTKGLVTFSTFLLGAPPECMEFVAVHEFTHFLRADHSPEFHRWMDGFLPDWKQRKKRLAEYGILLR